MITNNHIMRKIWKHDNPKLNAILGIKIHFIETKQRLKSSSLQQAQSICICRALMLRLSMTRVRTGETVNC